jgi:hypothetical protein
VRERGERELVQIWPFLEKEEENTKGRKMVIQMRWSE